MKKKLYFEPPKKTTLEEYLTLEYGKIRDVHIIQLAAEVPPEILEKDPSLNKDIYMPLKNFHLPLKFKRVDKYISKQYGKKYTHEIVIDDNINLNPTTNIIFNEILKRRKAFIKLSIIDLIVIDFQSFSWSESSLEVKINIAAIILSIAAIIVSIAAIFIE